MRAWQRTLALLLAASALFGCEQLERDLLGKRPLDPAERLRGVDFTPEPRNPFAAKPTGLAAVEPTRAPPEAQVFYGSDVTVRQPGRRAPGVPGGGPVQVNFENADLREVVRIILGDTLGLNYVFDPRVQGTATAATAEPISREAMVALLETLLRMNNAALVLRNGVYNVVPIAEAAGQPPVSPLGGPGNLPPAGYGVTIVPLQYVAAKTVADLVEPATTEPGLVRADPERNVLIVSGTQAERQSLIETIRAFDVNWLQGMSAGIFPLKFGEPAAVIEELETLFGQQEGGPLSGLLRLVPVERLNAVLAVSPRASILSQVKTWIDRLDKGTASGVNVYVYYVQNARAEDLAEVLNAAFGGEGGARGARSRTRQRVADGRTAARLGSSGFGSRTGSGQTGIGQTGSGRSGTRSAGAPGAAGAGTSGGAAAGAERASLGASVGTGGSGAASEALAAAGFGQIQIVADETQNALLITATPAGFRLVETALKQLDIAPAQVLIEATIAEVTLNDELRYGVQFFLRSGRFDFNLSKGEASTPSPINPGFNIVFTKGTDVKVVLDALSSVTNLKVISSPQVVVLDNQVAKLQVGAEVPVSTRQASSVIDPDAPIVSTIEFKNTGVILEVTPRINASGLVVMEIEQEVSQVAPGTTAGSLTPTITQRRVASTVAVQTGQTVFLGGLIEDSESRGRSGIPILSQIPILGAAFGSTENTRRGTELIVFITPRVIRNPIEAQKISEELRSRMRTLAPAPVAP